MICKWCGSAMKRGDNKCGRCGKGAAPLSSCGGFYDLVPSAKPAVPVAVPGQTKGEGKNLMSLILAGICVLLAILLLWAVFTNSSLKGQIADLEEDLEDIRSSQNDEQGVEPPEGTEDLSGTDESTGTVPSTSLADEQMSLLGQKEVKAELKLEHSKNSYEIAADACSEELACRSSDGEIVLSTADDAEGRGMVLYFQADETMFSIRCGEVDASIFGESAEGFRLASVFAGEEELTELLNKDKEEKDESAEETEDQEDSQENAAIEMKWKQLQHAMKQKKISTRTPITCTFVRETAEGGSLTIVISGILLPADN